MEPFRDGNEFKVCKSHFSQISGTVSRNFEKFELTEIMRQHDNSCCVIAPHESGKAVIQGLHQTTN